MKPKTMILMGLAITCGLGASYMTSRLLAERSPVVDEKVEILVAKRVLSVGERITKPEELFEIKQVSKENEPPDAIKDFDQLKGKFLKQGRNKGDHIAPINLYDKDGLEIPEGHQAVGLPVNLATTAAGFASLPGSRVDLILTIRGQDIATSSVRTLLQNVLVLAADARTNREGDIVSPASVVTFALKDEEKMKVSLAKELGILSLSLRKLNDQTVAEDLVMSGADLLANKKKDEPKSAAVVPTPEPVKAVEPPPAPEPKAIVEEAPKIIKSYYDIVNGSESGPREVTRVHYNQFEDGSIEIVRTEPIVVPTPTVAPNQKKGGGPRDF